MAAICNGLDPARFEVTLVYASRDSDPKAYRAACAGARDAVYVPEMTREVSPGRDAAALRRLTALLRERRPDVVHAHSSKAGALARLGALAAGVPRVYYSPHGYSFLQQDRSAASRALYRAVERSLSGIGEIVAGSPGEAALARGLTRKPVHVVCDAYLGGLEEPQPHEGLVIAACGRLTYARDPDAWVLLAQRLTDSRNGLRCLWIGGGEDEARVRTHLENMNLLGKVEVTGWLPAAEARRRLRAADVLVHYSRWEGLPNAVLDGMAAGLPVVASDIPGNRDAVVHGETGFLAGDEMELLTRCQELVDDAALRRRLGEAGRERVRREFSRDRMLARLQALYGGQSA